MLHKFRPKLYSASLPAPSLFVHNSQEQRLSLNLGTQFSEVLKGPANASYVSLPFSSPVLKQLRIEGDRPSKEIDPSNHLISIFHYDAMNHLKLNPRSEG